MSIRGDFYDSSLPENNGGLPEGRNVEGSPLFFEGGKV